MDLAFLLYYIQHQHNVFHQWHLQPYHLINIRQNFLHQDYQRSFLKRNVDINDVGNSALYLLSDLAGGVTGEIHYVDAGYNKVGMPDPKNITWLMSKRYSGKSFKDSSVKKKPKLSLKEKRRIKKEKQKKTN